MSVLFASLLSGKVMPTSIVMDLSVGDDKVGKNPLHILRCEIDSRFLPLMERLKGGRRPEMMNTG